jgi:hypothetical protein
MDPEAVDQDFRFPGSHTPEELADQTINRVARKLPENTFHLCRRTGVLFFWCRKFHLARISEERKTSGSHTANTC